MVSQYCDGRLSSTVVGGSPVAFSVVVTALVLIVIDGTVFRVVVVVVGAVLPTPVELADPVTAGPHPVTRTPTATTAAT
ncbi:hypothetical protein GCM10010171_24430 [Actinokineospora fastidiosa]|uniref:Uncharacterized protein n=1 Tax=Actinokineospora fastidiosa TaxID=1816 RepID=A0A918LCH8_9PSEU|nr:hypothetical protein GCM10010171_24430 [Actinokineospora fastidiosa]